MRRGLTILLAAVTMGCAPKFQAAASRLAQSGTTLTPSSSITLDGNSEAAGLSASGNFKLSSVSAGGPVLNQTAKSTHFIMRGGSSGLK